MIYLRSTLPLGEYGWRVLPWLRLPTMLTVKVDEYLTDGDRW